MSKDDLQFQIDQLRKDKIIYGVEACATTLICLFGLHFSIVYLTDPLRYKVNMALLAIAVIYTLYMGIGNAMRLMKVKKLEAELK
mgnify:CR=1 FL=1